MHDDDLVLATHGRSFWILDDVTPIRAMTTELEAKDAVLLKPRDAIRWRYDGGNRDIYSSENPPQGAMIHYYLKDEPKDDIAMRILRPDGTEVRSLSSKEVEPEEPEDAPNPYSRKPPALPKKKGLNRFVWDFRYQGAMRFLTPRSTWATRPSGRWRFRVTMSWSCASVRTP